MENNRVEQMMQIQEEARNIFIKKNADYGDAFAQYGTIGVLIRMQDKISRYMSVTNSSVSLIKDETLRDTLLDLHNYAAMAIMVLNDK